MTTDQLAHSFVEIIKGIKDPGELRQLLHEDLEFWVLGSTPVSGTLHGRDHFLAELVRESPLFDRTITMQATDVYIGPTWFVIETRGDSLMKHGEPYRNTYCFVFKVRDGKIAVMREYLDTELCRNVMCKGISSLDDIPAVASS